MTRPTDLSYYRQRQSPIFASTVDPRFSYCTYVPSGYVHGDGPPLPLAVLVHSTDRDAQYVRDEFVTWAEEHNVILYAPIFPAGIIDPEDVDNYKWLEYRGLRFDLLLLQMLEELRGIYNVDTERFLLTGFSGGAHFTHRFLFAHPARVMGASIAAPGVVTLLDPTRPWPVGVGGLEDALGVDLDLDEIRKTPVQLVIGDRDVETWEIGIPPGAPWYLPGVNDLETGRIERSDALRRSLEESGVSVRLDIVPGVAHEGRPLAPPTKRFFSDVLSGYTARAAGKVDS
ncbi:hypothetical protein ACFQZV_05965 [Microbacterium koreense]|uniref:Alpha/beta hydrolase n=1 Tax=Microbacterium koreense TaxID=323761 RepID=A0ABW2ZR45_9MICO